MVKLLEHQVIPIEYIVAKCKRQHGLIINHYMGSGKTVTGLTFLNNYPKEKRVLIIPDGFKNIWILEAKRLSIDISGVIFITMSELYKYEKYEDIISNSICVIDEAHRLYGLIDDLYYEKIDMFDDNKGKKIKIKPRLIEFINMMNLTKKILLMTGTIVGFNMPQIRWLVNIAAGQSIMPYNEEDFVHKYYKISNTNKIYNQVLKPFIHINPLGLIPKDIIKFLPIREDDMIDFIYTIMTTYGINTLVRAKINVQNITSDKKILDIERYKEILMKTKELATSKDMLLMILGFLIIYGTKMIFKYIKIYYQERYSYSNLDSIKLRKDNVHKYISHFDYRYTENQDYPKTIETVKKIPYTKSQIITLLRLIGIPENLTTQEYVDLEINSDLREAELFKDSGNIRSKYVDKGRILGNLYECPSKFVKISKMFIESGEKQTVVYSNFYKSGILLFAKYLKSQNIVYSIYHTLLSNDKKNKMLLDFKNKKIKLLLLHPDFYEGISIIGCNTLHILEPIYNSTIRKQLHARVVRYHSHNHLPIKERKVYINQWSCTLMYDINKILHVKQYTKELINTIDPTKTILNLFDVFKSNLSPDDKIISKYNKDKNFEKEFSKIMGEVNINKTELPIQCCIWTPDFPKDTCSLSKKLPNCF